MEGIGWGWLGLGFLHMVVFWGLVILAFAALFKWLGGGSLSESSAMDILKARYARGELTREQFEQLRREIGELTIELSFLRFKPCQFLEKSNA